MAQPASSSAPKAMSAGTTPTSTNSVGRVRSASDQLIAPGPGEPAELMSDQPSAAWLGLSRATFWRRVADGTLPRPIRLGGRTLWRRSELRAVIDNLAAERDGNTEK